VAEAHARRIPGPAPTLRGPRWRCLTACTVVLHCDMNALMQLANFWAIVQLLLALGGLVALLRNRAITPDEESRFCMGYLASWMRLAQI